MSVHVHAFAVFACTVVAACSAAVIAIARLKGRPLAVFACAIVATCAVLLLGCYGITCTNDLSSYNLARALVERRSLQLDPWIAPGSIDVSRFGNHYYSDRPPLTGWLAAVPYAAVYRASGAVAFAANPEKAVLLIPILATLFTMVALLRMSMLLGASEDAAILAVLVFAFASPAFVYGRVLFVHAVSAALVTAGCLALLRAASSARVLFAAGLLLGFSVIADYSNAVIVIIAGLWLVLRRQCPLPRIGRLALFVAGLVGPAGLLMAYDYACFGSPFVLSYSYCTFPWARTFSGTFSGSFVTGFLGLSVLPPTGIFVWSPVAVLGIAGLLADRRATLRGERGLLLALFMGVLLGMAKHKTWYGGGTNDARYLSSVFPLLLPGVAVMAHRLMHAHGRAVRGLVAIVVVGSVVLRWTWATRFIDCVRYARAPVVRYVHMPLVLMIMIGAIVIWFLAGARTVSADAASPPAARA